MANRPGSQDLLLDKTHLQTATLMLWMRRVTPVDLPEEESSHCKRSLMAKEAAEEVSQALRQASLLGPSEEDTIPMSKLVLATLPDKMQSFKRNLV